MRLREPGLAGLLSLGFVVAAVAQGPSKSEATRAQDRAYVAQAPLGHAALEQLAKDGRVCVVAVAMIKNRVVAGTDVVHGCGSAQQPGQEPVFQAASLGKPVFAYAVIKLAQQGRIALDVPLTRYLPQGYEHSQNPADDRYLARIDRVTAPALQWVTARMVLNHTSGLPNWAHGPLTFAFPPGSRWEYSGEGYVLLQRAVETVTGLPLNAFMHAQVFSPLAMAHSDYVWDENFESSYLTGTTAHGKELARNPIRKPIAAFSLYTSAGDYARFVAAVLSDGPSLQTMLAEPVQVEPDLDLTWGLGWGIETAPNDQFIWHWGNNPGYRAFVMASVKTGDAVVILTNGENGLAVAQPIVQAFLPGTRKAFSFSRLPSGLEHFVCRTFGLCF